MANKLIVKHFTSPDETRTFAAHGRMDVLSADGGMVGRGIFEPGWKWSKDMKSAAGTRSCQVSHALYVLSGRMHLKMDDGDEAEIAAGDYVVIPPGHDAWTVGNEPCVIFDFGGAATYAQRPAGADSTSAQQHSMR